jgi:hypothetical protein
MDTSFYTVDSSELINFAEKWAKLGTVVTSQVLKVLDGQTEGINRNAIEAADCELGSLNGEIFEAIQAFLNPIPPLEEDDAKPVDLVATHYGK